MFDVCRYGFCTKLMPPMVNALVGGMKSLLRSLAMDKEVRRNQKPPEIRKKNKRKKARERNVCVCVCARAFACVCTCEEEEEGDIGEAAAQPTR